MDRLKKLIDNYSPSIEAKRVLDKSRVIIFVGPTGAGKDTLQRELLKTGDFRKIITHTTREPRIEDGVKEVDGVQYHFINTDQALEMLAQKQFIEVAWIHGHMYGSSIQEYKDTLDQAKTVIADVDVKGIRAYRSLSSNVLPIFLVPPNFKTLLKRLLNRYGQTHKKEDITTRLNTALSELTELLKTDYYTTFVNQDKDITASKVIDMLKSGKFVSDSNAISVAKELILDLKRHLKQNI